MMSRHPSLEGKQMSWIHRTRFAALGLTALLGTPGAGVCEEPSATTQAEPTQTPPAPEEAERTRHPVLMYIPNRIFDLLDLVRFRVRVGPGLTVQARATDAVDVVLGAHATIFAGVPGPRGRPRINLPVGVEAFAGAEVSVVGDKTETGWSKPYYGPLEVGAGFQAAILGLDVGVDPLEFLDLAAGILFLDLLDDDY
jgi:hypothetical protein